MPKDCDKVAPGSLTSEGGSQPAQELDGALSKTRGASSQRWERAIGFLAELNFAFDALDSSRKFNFGSNAAIFFKHVLKNEEELVSDGLISCVPVKPIIFRPLTQVPQFDGADIATMRVGGSFQSIFGTTFSMILDWRGI